MAALGPANPATPDSDLSLSMMATFDTGYDQDVNLGPSSNESNGSSNKQERETGRIKRQQRGGVPRRVCTPCRKRKSKCGLGIPCPQCVSRNRPDQCCYPENVKYLKGSDGESLTEDMGLSQPPKIGKKRSSETSVLSNMPKRTASVGPWPVGGVLSRQSFEDMLWRYGDMAMIYNRPLLSMPDIHNLFDLWRVYEDVEQYSAGALGFLTESKSQRESLLRTFYALSCFTLGTAYSFSNQVSRTWHWITLAAEVGLHAARAIDKAGETIDGNFLIGAAYLCQAMQFSNFPGSTSVKVLELLERINDMICKNGQWDSDPQIAGLSVLVHFTLRPNDAEGFFARNMSLRKLFINADRFETYQAAEFQNIALLCIGCSVFTTFMFGSIDPITHTVNILSDFKMALNNMEQMGGYILDLLNDVNTVLDACAQRAIDDVGLQRCLTLLYCHAAYLNYLLSNDDMIIAQYAEVALGRWFAGLAEMGHPCNSVSCVDFLLAMRVLCETNPAGCQKLIAKNESVVTLSNCPRLNSRGEKSFESLISLLQSFFPGTLDIMKPQLRAPRKVMEVV